MQPVHTRFNLINFFKQPKQQPEVSSIDEDSNIKEVSNGGEIDAMGNIDDADDKVYEAWRDEMLGGRDPADIVAENKITSILDPLDVALNGTLNAV